MIPKDHPLYISVFILAKCLMFSIVYYNPKKELKSLKVYFAVKSLINAMPIRVQIKSSELGFYW